MTTAQMVMIAAIGVMLLLLVFLALAETALTRMTRTRAQALVEDGRPGAKRLARLVLSLIHI